jgi:hypothetical protein
MLLVKITLCSKLYYKKGLKLKHISYKIREGRAPAGEQEQALRSARPRPRPSTCAPHPRHSFFFWSPELSDTKLCEPQVRHSSLVTALELTVLGLSPLSAAWRGVAGGAKPCQQKRKAHETNGESTCPPATDTPRQARPWDAAVLAAFSLRPSTCAPERKTSLLTTYWSESTSSSR